MNDNEKMLEELKKLREDVRKPRRIGWLGWLIMLAIVVVVSRACNAPHTLRDRCAAGDLAACGEEIDMENRR